MADRYEVEEYADGWDVLLIEENGIKFTVADLHWDELMARRIAWALNNAVLIDELMGVTEGISSDA